MDIENYSYCCSEDGHGLKYPGFSAVFIHTFALPEALKFIYPLFRDIPKEEYDAKVRQRDIIGEETSLYESLADVFNVPIVKVENNIEKQIFIMSPPAENQVRQAKNRCPYIDIDPRSVYRFSLRGFDFRMPIEPKEEQDIYPVVLSGHAYVEMSLFFGNTVSMTYRFCFNGVSAKTSQPVMTDHIISLLSTFLGAEYWNHDSGDQDSENEKAVDRLAAQSDINMNTKLFVNRLWFDQDGKNLDTPRDEVDLSGNNREFNNLCLIYKKFIYSYCTTYSDGMSNRNILDYETWIKDHPISVENDSHYAMVDIWENVSHPVETEGGKEADLFEKRRDGLTEAQIINHIRDYHKPELIGLMTQYPFEWPYRDSEAYDQVCGRNIAIDTDDLVLAGTNIAVVIGTYGRRGDEVKLGNTEQMAGSVKKQGVDWADHLLTRGKYHVSWPEYLLILQMVLAKKYLIGVAKDQMVDVALTARSKSSEELIGQNAELGIRLSRLILQLDVVKYSKFGSHIVMFDRTSERLELEKDMEHLRDVIEMIDNSLHNLSEYKSMKSGFLLNVILALISCASAFQLMGMELRMPFMEYFNGKFITRGLAAWLITIVMSFSIFAMLLVAKNFIISMYEKIRIRNFKKEHEVIRDSISKHWGRKHSV